MKTKLLQYIRLFSYVIATVYSSQIFTCNQDVVGNITQIEKGNECLYTWISDASANMNTVIEQWREEGTESPLMYSNISVCKNFTGNNVVIQFDAQDIAQKNDSKGFRIAFDIVEEESQFFNYYYYIIFPENYNKSEKVTFKIDGLNEPVWNEWVNMQYIPIKHVWNGLEPVIRITSCEGLIETTSTMSVNTITRSSFGTLTKALIILLAILTLSVIMLG